MRTCFFTQLVGNSNVDDGTNRHCEWYSASGSNTIRTARSRTSGADLLGLPMTPPSQGMKPPVNPDRFTYQIGGLIQQIRVFGEGGRIGYVART